MKKTFFAVMMAMALIGCDDANKAVDNVQEAATETMDKVQETANEATEVVQEQMEKTQEQVDSVGFDFEQFASTSETAKTLSNTVKDAMNVDFSDPQAIEEMKDRIANAYQCYVESTSESEAADAINSMMASVNSDEVKSLIEKGIEKAKAVKECVM
ncbi:MULTISPECIES: hypothetical protein [Vibrio]|jgi:cysteinyl-tRNA synthetase|uniref:hypothetical protein n=1 Tax=Vibrio TaxID=662 RepID=UPI000BFFDA13|nr:MULTISPECIES: hypothetical protein [unclassified Vibrio]PHJ43053.1 hypothetical protein AK965_03075 [Vibrio sp. PID17_43]RIZ53548.1 hypothetical protein AK966_12660 [Vibrio sp. PID23_8]